MVSHSHRHVVNLCLTTPFSECGISSWTYQQTRMASITGSSPLLLLPAEIKNKIYKYRFLNEQVNIAYDKNFSKHRGSPWRAIPSAQLTALLRTCRQTHDETKSFFHSLVQAVVNTSSLRASKALSDLPVIPLSQASWNGWQLDEVEGLSSLYTRLPRLQTLTISLWIRFIATAHRAGSVTRDQIVESKELRQKLFGGMLNRTDVSSLTVGNIHNQMLLENFLSDRKVKILYKISLGFMTSEDSFAILGVSLSLL